MAISDRSDAVDDDRDGPSERPVDRIRRRVLESLEAAGCPLGLADLAVELARQEAGPGADAWERAECRWIELYHNHVPALEAAGLVEYHRERRTVALSPGALEQYEAPPPETAPA